MDVHLTRRTCLRAPLNDFLDDDGPREDLCGLAHLMERVQHIPAARPTGHKVKVQLRHAPKGCGINPGEDLVRQEGVHPIGRQEVEILRVDYVTSGTEHVYKF